MEYENLWWPSFGSSNLIQKPNLACISFTFENKKRAGLNKDNLEKIRRLIFMLFLIIAGFVCVISPKFTGYDAINSKASETVKDVLAENTKTFILVSGLKAGLAVIEGSTAGAVLVDVEIGDIVQPAYDFVDQIWKFLFYGLLILSMYVFILEFGLLSFGIRIIGIGFLAWGIGFLIPGNREETNFWAPALKFLRVRVPIVARACIMIGLLLAYLIPITLIASYGIRGFITEPVKAKKYGEIMAFEREFDQLKEEFISMKGELSLKHPLESSNRVKTKMRAIATSLLDAFNRSLQIFLYYIVIIFIEVLVFPLLTAYVLYKLGQIIIGKFLAETFASRNSTISESPGT